MRVTLILFLEDQQTPSSNCKVSSIARALASNSFPFLQLRGQAFANTLLFTRLLSAGEPTLSRTSHGKRTLHPHWGCIR